MVTPALHPPACASSCVIGMRVPKVRPRRRACCAITRLGALLGMHVTYLMLGIMMLDVSGLLVMPHRRC